MFSKQKSEKLLINKEDLPVFTRNQLALFDGSRNSKPVYLALLGRVYNVEKGRKHYAKGGGYSFFSGNYKKYNFFLRSVLKLNFETSDY